PSEPEMSLSSDSGRSTSSESGRQQQPAIDPARIPVARLEPLRLEPARGISPLARGTGREPFSTTLSGSPPPPSPAVWAEASKPPAARPGGQSQRAATVDARAGTGARARAPEPIEPPRLRPLDAKDSARARSLEPAAAGAGASGPASGPVSSAARGRP